MAEQDIIQNMIHQLGQSQDGRLPEELHADFAKIDGRSAAELLTFTRKFSEFVNFYRGTTSDPAGDWRKFFPAADAEIQALLESEGASTQPHLALFLAFLKLYEKPQALLNRFAGRHLDFFYRDVLRLTKKPAVPDAAHVLLELKKVSAPVSITAANVFSAGKDASGVELLYVPTGETIVNTSKVMSLRSLFLDHTGHGTVRYAPVADSADGVGGELPSGEPKWTAFGSPELPAAEVGFALASPVLRMLEGTRKVSVKLTLGNVNTAKLNTAALAKAFDVFITGAKSWLGPHTVSPTLLDSVLHFEFTIADTDAAVVDYDAKVHEYSYPATAPVIQVLLRAEVKTVGYNDFKGVTLQKAQVSVEVSGVTSLNLESDGGVLDPGKAFQPFGPQPGIGSRFMIGCDEALHKKLDELKIAVQWKDAPADFAERYAGYTTKVDDGYFKASVSFADAGSWTNPSSIETLFVPLDGSNERILAFSPGSASTTSGTSTAGHMHALNSSGRSWAALEAKALLLKHPIYRAFRTPVPAPRSGFITLALKTDFLHAEYRRDYVKQMMEFSKGSETTLNPLREPYTPVIQQIELSYKAHSDEVNLDLSGTDPTPQSEEIPSNDFSNLDLQFFHVAYFGQMREHGYQRNRFDFLADKRVSLLPAYENEGELLVGLENLAAGDSVSVLFQVAEGSANPDLPPEDIAWSVLCDNYWKPLGSEGVVLDTTNQLLASGTIKFVIPAAATAQNTILPAGQLWLRAGVKRNVTAVCKLLAVAANAVEVRFTDQGNDPAHLTTALEAGRIAKLKNGLAAVKTVKQPYASFDGSQEETGDNFHRRVSERLRHKDRCITPWDYERIILEAFPKVHKVKCIPHAREGSWLAPGHVMVIVVPDLRNQNAMDPLKPKVDADTMDRITEFARARAGMGVKLKVKNPTYQKIQVDFKVRFHDGFEFNFHSGQLKQRLIEFLSPWAFDSARDISFGGTIYKSVLLDFVEENESVDYVTDFRMYSFLEGGAKVDVNDARPATPDTILVSEDTHIVNPAD